jgi:hypothetical protein
MITLYCRSHHTSYTIPCHDCEALRKYAFLKLEKCSFADNKPPCSECSIHCYRKDMRDKIKAVMKYSGPRMIYNHPVLAIRHLLTKIRYRFV